MPITNAKLEILSEKSLLSYLEACKGFKAYIVTPFALGDPESFSEWKGTIFKKCEDQKAGIGLPEGFVPSSTYWLEEGSEFIGCGNIRHYLTESLERFGSHIGYAIRWDRQGMGYGALQIALLLEKAAGLGIKHVLLTCSNGNAASERVISKNGGVFQHEADNYFEGARYRAKRFWIKT